MQRRAVRSLILGSLAAILLAVGPVAGKMPYFSIEISPSEPRDGDVIVIVVRMWDDVRHTTPATWWPPEATVDGLIEARGPAGRVPVTFLRLDDATFRAELRLSAGTWQLVPFPRPGGGIVVGAAGDGYPAPLTVTVGSRMAETAAAIVGSGALGIATVALLVGGPFRRRLRKRLGPAAA